MFSDPSFLSALSSFLQSPVVRLEPSERVSELERDNERLRLELEKLNLEYLRMKSMFQDEMSQVFRLQDICREHGIKWR